MTVPEPVCVTAPVPLMTLVKVKVSVRLKATTPELVMSPTSEPEVPALPNCKVPAATVVPPE